MEELQTLIQSIKGLIDIDDELLTEESMQIILTSIDQQFSSALVTQSINQIIKNFDDQGLTKQEAKQAIDGVLDIIKDMINDGTEYSENKQKIIDTLLNKLSDIFNTAASKYHTYSIELPMTIDTAGGAQVPTYAHDTDAAADLYASETTVLNPHSLGNKIRTGVKIELPEGWLAFILPRSSIGAKTPLRLSNSVGLIDSGYRGELGVLYDNIGDEEYTINAGDRIAQLLVMPSYRFQAKVVDILADSDRGETGFGDSGK